MAGLDPLQKLQQDAIASIAGVSTLLRNAIAAALPVAPEQYLTIAIPGTVIDLADYDQGGSFVYDVSKYATTPTSVRQAEASLVDGIMPIASIMIGNTGKSVARSYSRSLDALLPAKATISSLDGIRSPGNPDYDKAMAFLQGKSTGSTGNIVQIYRDKQLAWAREQSAWDTGKIEAAKRAAQLYPPGSDPDFIVKQKQYINEWIQENYFAFTASIQAAWMDWVVNGQKYDVDFNFGIIDIDSIMSRIESSKQSMRNSMIPDIDGAAVVYGVSLTPNRWATYCKRKAEGWYEQNGNYTLAQLDSEIARLGSLLTSYQSAGKLVTQEDSEGNSIYPATGVDKPKSDPIQLKNDVSDKLSALYKAQAVLSGANYNYEQVKELDGADSQKAKDAETLVGSAQTGVSEAQKALKDAEDKYYTAQQNWNGYNSMVLKGTTVTDTTKWLATKQETIQKEIDRLNALRAVKVQSSPVDIPVISGVTAPTGDKGKDNGTPSGTALATKGSELANPIFKSPDAFGGQAASAEDADPWTNITFSYSASDVKKNSEESQWGMKAGGSVGFGLWSVGGSYSHDEAHSSMQEDMAACDVSVSFSALVVNINRPWLYGELFSDVDIEVANGVNLSPGPLLLQKLIKDQKADDIAMWSQFPAYPTSFIVAADTTIEFTGTTKHIEEHFDTHSNSGGASVGYGPWSVSSSFHESATQQSMQVHSTATGCKISFGAPQIIGWVSQILPALPRPDKFNPLTQGGGIPVPTGNV